MRKPRIFIASAAESLNVADAINVNLDHSAEVTVWKHGFSLSNSSIDSLIQKASSVDFAIFVFTPDDISTIRSQEKSVVRDNVVFELGLFIGTLGKERCFIVKPRDTDLHLPTDLLGLTPADYNGSRSDRDLEAAVNPTCALIRKEIEKLGLISQPLSSAVISPNPRQVLHSISATDNIVLAKLLESYNLSADGTPAHTLMEGLRHYSPPSVSISIIKLQRAGFIEKSITQEQQYEYYSFSITHDGMDYILENEDLFSNINF